MKYFENNVTEIRDNYPPGTQIVINEMIDPRPIPSGIKGVVDHVDDMGTIHCTFENGRKLGVIPGEDDFSIIKQQLSEKIRVFVDMDGCTAEFKPTTQFEDLFEKGYFRNLKPLKKIIETVKALDQNPNYEVYILSSTLKESKYAEQEKRGWLKEYLPELTDEQIIFSQCGKSKVTFVPGGVRESDILLDDYNNNLKEFALAGAKAIKVVNGINDTHHSWDGERIYHTASATNSVNTINNVAGLSDSNDLQYKPILPNEISVSPIEPSIDFLY